MGRTSGGIYLKLSDTEKGFVTFRRIFNSLGNDTFVDIMNIVKDKYPRGKELKCRILDYNRLDAVYICAVEASILNERFFTKDDLTLGQLVTAYVTEIKDGGLVVKFGHLQGFIDNIHLSNAEYSENIKSKFRVNQKLKARVLTITNNNSIRLTAKPALVESDLCLVSSDQAEIGKLYPGVVIRRTKFGALIIFYGDVKGFVYCTHLLPGETADARDVLFDGQVVNVTITGQNSKGLELSLIPVKDEVSGTDENESFKEESEMEEESEKQHELVKLKIGQEVSGTIHKIKEKGLIVNLDKGEKAVMPLNHLSVNYDLNPLLLSTFY